MVSGDPERVESELAAGVLRCPECGDRLAPWAYARRRNLRLAGGIEVRLRPRRGRCVGCLVTHVLSPDSMLVRRRDHVEVIGSALTAAAGGEVHRRIAKRLGVAESTVRGWLRRFRSRATVIAGFFTQWALVLGRRVGPAGSGRHGGG